MKLFCILILVVSCNLCFCQDQGSYYLSSSFNCSEWNLLSSYGGVSAGMNTTLVDDFTKHPVFCEDSENRIWIRKKNGVIILHDNKPDIFLTKEINQQLPGKSILHIISDDHHSIWIATNNGVFRYSNGTAEIFNKKNKLPSNKIVDMVLDKYDNIWIFTNKGVVRFDQEKWYSAEETRSLEGKVLSNNNDDIYFFSSDQGGCGFFNGEEFVMHSLPYGFASAVVDRNGHLWFLGEKAIMKFDSNEVTTMDLKIVFPNSFSLLIDIVEQDNNGNIWLGITNAQDGLFMYDGETFTQFTSINGFKKALVKEIYPDNTGNVWISTRSKGLYKYQGGSLQRVRGEDGFFSINESFYHFYKMDGKVWIPASSGLYVYDGKSGIFSDFNAEITSEIFSKHTEDDVVIFKETDLKHFYIALFQDSNQEIWAAVTGIKTVAENAIIVEVTTFEGIGGIGKYSDTGWEFLSSKINDDAVLSIFEDSRGYLYADTQKGIYIMKQSTKE